MKIEELLDQVQQEATRIVEDNDALSTSLENVQHELDIVEIQCADLEIENRELQSETDRAYHHADALKARIVKKFITPCAKQKLINDLDL